MVVGGGLAGLAAAEALLSAGHPVRLYEQHDHLGGRASSFRDPLTGWLIENGQHIWMPPCTELRGFLQRTGADALTHTQELLDVTYLERGRGPARLRASRLPGAASLLLPLLRFPLLGSGDRLALLRAMVGLKMGGHGLRERLGEAPFLDWLQRTGQSERSLRVFWEPFIGSILNEPLEDASSRMAVMALQETVLAERGASRLAWTTRPQSEVWEAAASCLAAQGGHIRRGVRVEKVELARSGEGPPTVQAVHLTAGERVPAAGAVLAVGPSAVVSLLPAPWDRQEEFVRGMGLTWSPILNIHVWFEDPVTDSDVCCVVDSPLHWVFRKPAQEPEGGRRPVPSTAQHLNLIASYSRGFLGQGPDDIVPLMLEELAAHVPAARAAGVLATRVVHERRATFRAVAASAPHRPSQATGIPNLALAGAWTDTGWPSTLEGAVRSGRAAAQALGVQPD